MSTESKLSKEEIIRLEKSYWDAIKMKDGNRTAELSGKVALVTGSNGVMSIPKSKMSDMTEKGNWTLESYAFDDINVIMPADDVAIIAYTVRQKVKMGGNARELTAADSSTWLKGKNGWECHAHSETFLKDN